MTRLCKFLHLLGAIVFTGILLAGVALLTLAPPPVAGSWPVLLPLATAAVTWLLVPGLLVTVVSGLLAIAAHRPFMEAPWVWLKGALGMLLTAIVLARLQPGLVEAARLAASGAAAPLEGVRASAALALIACLLAIALGVWRPRLASQRRI
jgi:hypothetical protein